MGNDALQDISEGHEELAKLSAAASFGYFMTMFKGLNRDTSKLLGFCEIARNKMRQEGGIPGEAFEDLDFWYRSLVRSFVTEVEGILYVMRRIVVWANERREIDLSSAEDSLVREQEFFVNLKRKRIEGRSRSNRLMENFYLTFSLFPRVFRSAFVVNYGDHGWEMFQRVVKARNEITHPKNFSDLTLATDTYNAISEAIYWFYGAIGGLLEKADREFLERSYRETSQNPKLHELANRFREEETSEAGAVEPLRK